MTSCHRSRLSARPGMLAVLLTALLIGGLGPTPVYAQPGSRALLTFDDLPAGTPVFNQYPGVTFVDGDRFDHPVVISAPPTALPSPALLATTTVLCAHEFQCRSLRIVFEEPQSLVQLSTGLTTTVGNVTVQVTGLDASGTRVVPPAQSDDLCLKSGPTPVKTPLSLNDPTASIVEVDVTYVTCTGPSAGQPLFAGSSGIPIEIDDLAYTLPLNPLPREHDPPICTSIAPANGSTVNGRYAEEILGTLSVVVQETPWKA